MLLCGSVFQYQAKKDLPDLTASIGKGNLLPLKGWLNEKIHRWGRTYSSEELVRRVTGEGLNPRYFIDYMKKKFGEIYRLS